MILSKLFSRKADPASALYGAIVAAARQERFYREWDVPDTLDGRFDMMVLHLYLVLNRLRECPQNFRQRLTDLFFADLDRTLREMGVGDLSVSKKIRPMAEAYSGRLQAYVDAEKAGKNAWIGALERNVYGGKPTLQAKNLAEWVAQAQATLAAQNQENLMMGKMTLP
ncbi:MAG: ubiquinol-cytochrome C chaperone [Alphaproteobacteria bacterium]|nr:ubiquinol-cytochrome C chaperone [Alphaproteobacteria bacterium]